MQKYCVAGVAVYLTLVEPQCTKQGQTSRAEERQVHLAGECGQELGGSVPMASPAGQKAPEGRWPSRLCSGGCLSSASAHVSPHRQHRKDPSWGSGDVPDPLSRSRGDPEFRGH